MSPTPLYTHTRTHTQTISLSRTSSANKVYIEAEVRQPCQKRPIYTKRDQYISKQTNIYQKRRIDSKNCSWARRAAMGESPSQITFVLRLFCGSLFVYIGLCGHFGRTSAPRSRRQIVLQQKASRFCVVYFGTKKWSIRRDIVRFQPRRFFLCRALSHLKDLIFKFFRLACERRGSFISRTSLLHIKDRPQKSNWGRNGR